MNPNKVIIYYPRAMSGDGGVTNSLWLWAESLQRAGAAVEVVYDTRLPVLPDRTVPAGVRVRGVQHCGRGRFAIPRRMSAILQPGAVVLLHSGYVLFNFVVGVAARRRKVPYVVVPHGAYDPHVRAQRRVIRRLWEVAERYLLAHALAVHVFFDLERVHVQRVAPGAVTVTAPTAYTPPQDEGWQPTATYGYVAWLGRFDVRHKGLDRLLDAVALLPPEHRPLLRLRGRDHKDSRASIDILIRDRGLADHVTVGTSIDGQEKRDFLAHADAYVHPARWESYGVALVENLALGVPCITTLDVNFGRELRDADAALVVDGSAEGLAAGLSAVHDGQVARFGPRGREFVRTRLALEETGRTLLTALDMLAEADRR